MAAKTKLELTWIGKDIRPRLEPRILIEDPEYSHHAEARREGDIFDNVLIHGDNLLALKALETDPNVRGKVKCVFIDPPYNTGSAFEHYDDGLEHSLWLGMMRDRLEILRNLLTDDGSLWITIDDNEGHYLKVLCDEVFGRRNFVSNIVWQKRYARDNNAAIGSAHDHILVYAMSFDKFRASRNKIELDDKTRSPYKNPNNDPLGPWQSISFTGAGFRSNMMYPIFGPDGREHRPPEGRHWAALEPEYKRLLDEGRIWFGSDGKGVPRVIRYLSEVEGLIPSSWWPHDEVGHNDEAKKDAYALLGKEAAFATPKPERLLSRIVRVATNPGDLVLDSFAGSGTTGAVAHKMGRRWIMVELGDHAKTHIVPRMKKVIDGQDKGGVTEAASWKGGGGYRFFRLAPSLLEKDQWGNWVISKGYNPEMLAEAMCKHFNYAYAPSTEHYWMHGQSSEGAFIYVTTNSLTFDQLRAISDEVGENRSLLICCTAYEAGADRLANLTVQKIPQAVLTACEWGKDDYSLKIESLPMMAEDEEEEPLTVKAVGKRGDGTRDLFADDQEA
ncbi:site-specific DNA-methyltransferase [Neogemmobacter tilapiae]|uniref:site-specific DNA-methyltransferase (adenine-specific) n=1 Tax=Neogemmobacter tilapiae TaxID=875041 RepID=A0A918WIB8_9RHOB|nr:site-specific DNA-methyltransferase [Gemmobacter tilapiae]GHC54138.1 site-specific DNA-methyltransferase [Gemmobacter tilapiae]